MHSHPTLVRALPFAVLLASASQVSAGDAWPFAFSAVTGEVSGGASAWDFASGEESSESFFHDLSEPFPRLPIQQAGDAVASTVTAFGSSYADASASAFEGLLEVSASAGADAYGDGFDHDASADAQADIQLGVVMQTPVWARIRLDGFSDQGGGATAWCEWAGQHLSFDGEGPAVEVDWMISTGSLLTLGSSAGAGVGGVDGFSPYGGATASIEVLTEYEGNVFLGDNEFDTTGAAGTFDMTGHCDPGEFGDDVIEAPAYFLFVPPRAGTYTFSTCNQTALDTRIAITDYGPTPDRVIACGDESEGCAGYTTKLTVDLAHQINYTVVLGGTFDQTGSGTLTISLQGDFDGDGHVNGSDLGLLLGAWGTDAGDLNGDGTTDGADFGILLSLFTD